jgi:hypothetical protein
MLPLLPNWYYAQLPRGWWPDRPREFYCYQLNVIPFSTPFGTTFQKEIVFSKRSDAMIFGAQGLVTTVPAFGAQMASINPQTGASVALAVALANPSADIQYTSPIAISSNGGQVGGVPWESIFSQWGYAGIGGIASNPAQMPCFWPVPVPVLRGGSLLLSLTSIRNPLPANFWIRLTFWCCLLYDSAQVKEAA